MIPPWMKKNSPYATCDETAEGEGMTEKKCNKCGEFGKDRFRFVRDEERYPSGPEDDHLVMGFCDRCGKQMEELIKDICLRNDGSKEIVVRIESDKNTKEIVAKMKEAVK